MVFAAGHSRTLSTEVCVGALKRAMWLVAFPIHSITMLRGALGRRDSWTLAGERCFDWDNGSHEASLHGPRGYSRASVGSGIFGNGFSPQQLCRGGLLGSETLR